ncbi:MAG: glycosyltransferase family 9 protein [Gammaproteobacteria bacterium]|nr:glycosyltransferase family 9 protein [Gammaproteobacteria bacterium]
MTSTRVLIVRNDKLGDFVLALPLFALLKHYAPHLHLTALVPSYTAPLAEASPWIDAVVIDTPGQNLFRDLQSLHHTFRFGDYDILLTLFSSGRVALSGCLSGIPYRLAPATKIFQFCYNHRLRQRRSRSHKPEYAYNLDLGEYLLQNYLGITLESRSEQGDDLLPSEIERPILRLDGDLSVERERFCLQHQLPPERSLLFIHPGSGGSANNLRPDQYAALAVELGREPCSLVIVAGPGEEKVAQEVVFRIATSGVELPVTLYHSTAGLIPFARTLQLADLFISGSTGPLHIAGALNISTAAFYPRHRSATPLRWQTLNAPERRLVFTPPPSAAAEAVTACNLEEAITAIRHHLRQQS